MLDTKLLSHASWAMFTISKDCQSTFQNFCGILLIYFSGLIEVTMINKIIQIWDAQFHNTSQASAALWVYDTNLVPP